jgi:hypothetical protein
MPTIYRLVYMAAHPLGMGFKIPEGPAVLAAIEEAVTKLGLEPVHAAIERNDDKGELQYESKAWVHNAPASLLNSIAQYFEEQLDLRNNLGSDMWDPEFAGTGVLPLSELVASIVEARKG